MPLNVRYVYQVQLLCTPDRFPLLTYQVRAASQTWQWIMTLYAADPDTIVSPTVIIAFGSLVYFFSLLDVAIDVWFPRDHRPEEA